VCHLRLRFKGSTVIGGWTCQDTPRLESFLGNPVCCLPNLQKVESSGRVIGLEPFPDAAQAARDNVESHIKWCNEEQAQKVLTAFKKFLKLLAGVIILPARTFLCFLVLLQISSVLPAAFVIAFQAACL